LGIEVITAAFQPHFILTSEFWETIHSGFYGSYNNFISALLPVTYSFKSLSYSFFSLSTMVCCYTVFQF